MWKELRFCHITHWVGQVKKLNIDYPLDGVRVPTQEEVAHAEEMLGIQK